ncbi:MAG: RNA polymerase sigma-70 factor [Bacteroidales bacterium]|nr:RNA polymerase sigma-70 factor [Bacteroidales bacterium]MBN2818577.1 RNA polymerase sigma-70 factor [Bacteroidales bacterium]
MHNLTKKDFEGLFKSFYPALCSFANKYINNHELSEDLVQDVFFSLWNNSEITTNIQSVKSYLYSSVRNKCLNEIKHNKIVDNHISDELSSISSTGFFHDHIIEEELHRMIHKAIKELPEKCAEIILLSIEGQKNNEIAETLNISVNTVKTQKKIAYQQLRIKLKYLYILSPIIFQKFL